MNDLDIKAVEEDRLKLQKEVDVLEKELSQLEPQLQTAQNRYTFEEKAKVKELKTQIREKSRSRTYKIGKIHTLTKLLDGEYTKTKTETILDQEYNDEFEGDKK